MRQVQKANTAFRLIGILAFVCISRAGNAQIVLKSEANPIISNFSVSEVPALQALLQLAHNEKIPLGIVVADDQLCKTEVSYSAQKVPASEVAQNLIGGIRGYTVRLEQGSHFIVVGPVTRNAATEQFLSLIDDHYAVKGNPQTLVTMLWVHIRAILYPDQGTAGSILGSPDDAISEVDLKNASVERILNRIALKVKGAWLLRPLPATLAHLGPQPPFYLFPEAGDSRLNLSDPCIQVPESDPK